MSHKCVAFCHYLCASPFVPGASKHYKDLVTTGEYYYGTNVRKRDASRYSFVFVLFENV